MTRKEHLDWCKQRALKYLDMGDTEQAFTSMCSDVRKNPETENHSALEFGMMLYMGGHLGTPEKMRQFINGFN